ncbi:MAG: hypothetical protein U0174_25635 [Polyangiaceae bacterium]
MKTLPALTAITLLTLAATVQADQVPTQATVNFEYLRQPGDTLPVTKERALLHLNHRLLNNLNDGDGWSGIAKARFKFPKCADGLTFKGVPYSGFEIVRTGTVHNLEKYTGTITKIRCE